MDTRRTVWRIDRAGSLDRLHRIDETLPAPVAGEVQVAVRAVGLNFADVFACLGLYSATPAGSFVPGLEAAGVVTALGPVILDRPRFAVGDRVVVLTRFGGYATALNVDARYLTPVPADWTFEQAAAWPVQALTAWYGLVRLGAVRAGHVVLVQSAAGGVGLQALAILARLGARPVAIVGSDDKARFLAARHTLPAACIVVRRATPHPAALDAALAEYDAIGFDVVFDAVMGPGFRPAYERLAPEGRYVLYGAADFMPTGVRRGWLRLAWQWLRRPRLDPLAMISLNRAFFGFNLIWLWESVDRAPAAYAELAALALPPPHVGQRYAFRDALPALDELKAGQTIGKSVLWIDGSG
jgi:alcohol dehydrogenase